MGTFLSSNDIYGKFLWMNNITSRNTWNEQEMMARTLNTKVTNALYCVSGEVEYKKMSLWSTAKKIFDFT